MTVSSSCVSGRGTRYWVSGSRLGSVENGFRALVMLSHWVTTSGMCSVACREEREEKEVVVVVVVETWWWWRRLIKRRRRRKKRR